MFQRSSLRIVLITVVAFLLVSCNRSKGPGASPATDPALGTLKVVRFANLPYADHTYSSIGVAKGWFKEVGIDLRPQTIKIEQVVPSLSDGSFDVASVPPGILFSSYDTAPNLCTFVFGDLFQGYAIMAQPDKGYKSYSQLRQAGMSHADAVRKVVQQMKGKTFAYPAESAIKPFIDILFEQGGMRRSEVKALVLDDPLTVVSMRTKRADFEVGGVPSRITLQKEGFIPIISSVDLAKGARPSPNSMELGSILENGWAMRKDLYRSDPATALRLASVNYRIMKFMGTNPSEAMTIHMAYLSKVTGQKFTVDDGKVIYDSLDPFVTFESQCSWFHDPNDPLYYANVNGAILQSFISDKIYRGATPTVGDVIYADATYRELERLKAASDDLFAKLAGKTSLPADASSELADAKRFYDDYDFYDSDRLAAAAWQAVGGK